MLCDSSAGFAAVNGGIWYLQSVSHGGPVEHIFSEFERRVVTVLAAAGGKLLPLPTDDNQAQTQGMKKMRLFSDVNTEIGDIIVAAVDRDFVKELVQPDSAALKDLIQK